METPPDDEHAELRAAVARRVKVVGRTRFAREAEALDYKTLVRFLQRKGPPSPITVGKLERAVEPYTPPTRGLDIEHERRVNEELMGGSLADRERLVDVLRAWRARSDD